MLVIFWAMIKKNINWIIAFIGTLIIAYLGRYAFTDRGQIISYLMFLIEIILIENFLKDKNILSVIRIIYSFSYYSKYSFNNLDNVFSIIFAIYWRIYN